MRRPLQVLVAAVVLTLAPALFAQPAVAPAAEQSVTSIIRETMLGAIAVGAVVLAIWAIRTLKQVQDDRVADKNDLAERLEGSNEKDRAAQAEMTRAVSTLANAQAETTRAIDRNTTAIDANTRELTVALREAGRRRPGDSGGYPATRPRDPSRDPRRDEG